MDASSDALIGKLYHLSATQSPAGGGDLKKEALALSKQLTASLEDPLNKAIEFAWLPFISMGAKAAIDLDLPGLILRHKGPITASKLAEETGAEELLISRILRLMSSVGAVREANSSGDSYMPTQMTEAMASSPVRSGYNGPLVGSAAKAPTYLREVNYKCPQEPTDGFFQYAFGTKQTIFDYLASNQELQGHFDNYMGNTMGSRPHWVDWLPVQDMLLEGSNDKGPLVVDIAGGKGHDLAIFHDRYPKAGRLVLQDLPVVIDAIKDLDPAIERVKYDIFTEQPIIGARAYHFHHILHDWSDKYCLKILAALKPAMVPGYSKLLINELILPDSGATTFQAIFDLTLMTFNAGMERSQKQWSELLNTAGFKVVKFWLPNDDGDGIIEAVLK